MSSKRLPTLFVNHGGGPLPIIGEPSHVDLTNSLKHLTQTLTFNTTIAAILVISAHWEATKFTVLTAEHPSNPIPLYYDYSGFPPESYTYQYNPPGEPKVADRIIALLHNAGLVAEKAQQRQRQAQQHQVDIKKLLFVRLRKKCPFKFKSIKNLHSFNNSSKLLFFMKKMN